MKQFRREGQESIVRRASALLDTQLDVDSLITVLTGGAEPRSYMLH